MSLVNQMLKDLEARKQVEGSLPKEPLPLSAQNKPGPRSRFFVSREFLMIAIFIVLIILVWFWQFNPFRHRVPAAQKAVQSAEVSTTQSAAVVPVGPVANIKMPEASPAKISDAASSEQLPVSSMLVASASLSDVKVQQQENEGTVTIYLSDQVHYQFNVSADHQLLTLTLDDTKLSDPFPDITPTQSMVQSVSVREKGNALVIHVKLLQNTEVQEVAYNDQDNTQLVVKLSHLDQATVANEQTAKQTIKASASTASAGRASMEKVAVPFSGDQQAQSDYQKALEQISQDQIDSAVALLQTLVKQYPKFLPARKSLATLLMKEENYILAQHVLLDGLKLTPDSVDLIMLYARYWINRGNSRQALTILQSVNPSLEQYPDYYATLAVLQQKLGKPMEASRLYEQLINDDPSNGRWWLGLGMSLEMADHQNEAIQAYKKALNAGNITPSLQMYLQSKISQLGG